jgi:putative transposase
VLTVISAEAAKIPSTFEIPGFRSYGSTPWWRPDNSWSVLLLAVKKGFFKRINENKLRKDIFLWQEGIGGFSCSKSDVPIVISYIQRQEEHHRKVSFPGEYRKYPDGFGIDYNEACFIKAPVYH